MVGEFRTRPVKGHLRCMAGLGTGRTGKGRAYSRGQVVSSILQSGDMYGIAAGVKPSCTPTSFQLNHSS